MGLGNYKEILSDKNVGVIENTFSYSNMSVTKAFTLAPVFNYYIMIYGLPVPGVGFDPVKIAFLKQRLIITRNKGVILSDTTWKDCIA